MKNTRIVISNVGAIKHVDITCNKINIFIGAQGSGKSTIAKIISYFTWAEKQIMVHLGYAQFMIDGFFYEKLVTFHKLEGYFNDDSIIEYHSPYADIVYKHSEHKPHITTNASLFAKYERPKISYIPAERNIVAAIPNWFEVKFPYDNNIISFMSDWETARKRHSTENKLSLLNNTINYHYDENEGDIVIVDDHVRLKFTNTASGFQSIIPLFTVAEYIVKYVYEDEANDSVQNRTRKNEIVKAALSTFFKGDDLKNVIEQIGKDLEANNIESENVNKLKLAQSLSSVLTQTKRSKIIVEEIEQNLFPQSQCEATYHLLSLIQSDTASIVLTTHSPYVLFAINNCIIGGKVGKNIPEKEKATYPSSKAWIDPSLVSIWQITDKGTIEYIKDPDSDRIGKHYFNDIMSEVMGEYFQLLKYLDINGHEK